MESPGLLTRAWMGAGGPAGPFPASAVPTCLIYTTAELDRSVELLGARSPSLCTGCGHSWSATLQYGYSSARHTAIIFLLRFSHLVGCLRSFQFILKCFS